MLVLAAPRPELINSHRTGCSPGCVAMPHRNHGQRRTIAQHCVEANGGRCLSAISRRVTGGTTGHTTLWLWVTLSVG
jgi:hypothetical protein